MKKFTIIASPEFEPLILGEIGRTRVAQLKEVTGVDFESLKKIGERSIDYEGLYDKFHETYRSLVDAGHIEPGMVDLSIVELRDFIDDPDDKVNEFLNVFEEVRKRLEIADARKKERERKLLEARATLESVRALQPDELKRCTAVGVVDLQILQRLVEYLRRFEELSYKIVEISPMTGFVFVFGPEERREWVETLFIIFEVKDIFDVLRAQDVLLVLDEGRRGEAIKEYEEEVEKLQGVVEREDDVSELKNKYAPILGKARFLDNMLRILSNKRASTLRTNVISVIQGWIPENKLQVLDKIIKDLHEKTGELFFIEYEDPSHDDHEIPTPTPEIKPSFLQPAWTLTSLRGWPSAHEVNPNYITILVFSFQFGLMYGDIGQGLIFLILGLILSRKYKQGMMSKLGVLFIPMGIAAIIFGVLYDSFFLIEGLVFHHHSILPSPVHNPTKLMLLVFQIAVIELIAGLVLGAINEYKAGHKWGVLGEHGLGMILYILGLYLSAMYFIRTGDFMAVMSYWTFYVMVGGMVLAMLEPIIAAVAGGHFGIEVFGEGVGALLMTFVEGLANLFSFLRIAAFALAHASLAIAAHSMSHFMGVGGLLLMNTIAMSFEFISSSVQSLRLLYYEFMGKFFHGGGIRFRPFRVGEA